MHSSVGEGSPLPKFAKIEESKRLLVWREGRPLPYGETVYFSVLINASIRSKAWLMCLTE